MSAPAYLAAAGDLGRLRSWLSALVPPRDTPHRLDLILDTGDLVVLAAPETPRLLLEERRGIVIGSLFSGAGPSTPVGALSLSQSRHAAWSRGRSLLEDLWGTYVAFLRDEDAVTVLRDPSGAVPACHAELDGVQLYASNPAVLDEILPGPGAIDEAFLRHWLTFPYLRTARTGLEGRHELLPGTARTSSGGSATVETLWTPWEWAAAERQIMDFEEAARRLCEVALATVPAQLAGLEEPVLELSGGLDSSLVAACLTQARIPFRAANFVTRLPDGDERDYARTVADASGIALAELVEDDLPLDLSPAPRGIRPGLSPVLQPLRRAIARHARESGARHFVTGAGGDNLFGYITTAAPILDAAATIGLAATLPVVQDVAALGECTIWKAGRFALNKALRQRRRPAWKADPRFLSADAVADAPDPHPWLARPEGALPGKIEHVESLIRVQHFVESFYPSGEQVHHPLLNQKLTELCLTIPTWLWVRGGRNRAVAREAFAGLLPDRIIRRRTKGRLESMCARAYSANRERLRELLLGGELVRRGLLDRPPLEAYLAIPGPPPDDRYYRLFDLVSMELWLRARLS